MKINAEIYIGKETATYICEINLNGEPDILVKIINDLIKKYGDSFC